MKTALITGVTGQDGAYLSAFLLDKGYAVHGMRPYAPLDDTTNIRSVMDHDHFTLHTGDLTDSGSLMRCLAEIAPDEIYNLGAISHVKESFHAPEAALNVNGGGTLKLLEAIRTLNMTDAVRFYQASSSELFGNAPAPQNEHTPFDPCSPYAASKLYAYAITKNYRNAYGLHASNGILFNHESPLRGEEFVTRKITRGIAAILAGKQDHLTLGNLDAKRDWGHARDYVRGMWLMLQQDTPDDYVLATGQARSVRDFVETACAHAGITLEWRGSGLDETGIDTKTGHTLIRIDEKFYRPHEVTHLCGDAAKARDTLGWTPDIGFKALVTDMMNEDMAANGVDLSHRNDDNTDHVYTLYAAE